METDSPLPRVEVRRSRRRTRTVSAFREKDAIVVLVPARLSAAEEEVWVAKLVERVMRAERRRQPTDDELAARSRQLSQDFLEGRAHPASVRWVGNQNSRWGSCTPADGTIRISDRLRGMPAYVVDYVLVHELTHLLVGGHGPEFWAWVRRYPDVDRARGFLEGVAATAHLSMHDVDDEDPATPGNDQSAGAFPPEESRSAVASARGGA
jgi:predicted metal-dependent hydrolase